MSPEDVIRSFIAIEISDEVREGLKALQQDLKKAGAKVGWVAPENIHLTLVFLGDVFRSQVEPLANVSGCGGRKIRSRSVTRWPVRVSSVRRDRPGSYGSG